MLLRKSNLIMSMIIWLFLSAISFAVEVDYDSPVMKIDKWKHTGKLGFLQDITCPPQPHISESEGCVAKCPAGYHVSTTGRFFDPKNSGGYYACMPDNPEKVADIYQSCVYYNPNCPESSVSASIDKIVTEKYGDELHKIFSSGDTFIDRIVRIATLDFSIFDTGTGSLTPKTGKTIPAIFVFFKDLVDALGEQSWGMFAHYLFPSVFWLFTLWGTAHLFEAGKINFSTKLQEDFLGYIKSRFQDVFHSYVLFFRIGAGLVLFFFPTPTSVTSTTPTPHIDYTPTIAAIVRYYVLLGNELADGFAEAATKAYLKFALNRALEMYNYNSKVNYTAAYNSYMKALAYEKELKTCWKIYGKVNFIVPDDELKNIEIKDYDLYYKTRNTRRFCRKAQSIYKKAINSYNLAVASYYSSQEIKKFLEEHDVLADVVKQADSLSNEDIYYPLKIFTSTNPYKLIVLSNAMVVKSVKEFGWFTYPIVAIPLASLLESQDEITKDLAEITGVGDINSNVLARAIALLSFPPGSWIFSTVGDLSKKLYEVISGMSAPLTGIVSLIPFVGERAVKVAQTSGAGIVAFGVIVISYALAKTVMAILPSLMIAIVFVVRVLFWVAEIVKTIIVAPFVFLHFFFPQRASKPWNFLAKAMALGVFPLLLLAGSVLAFLLIHLVDLIFYIPVSQVFEMLGRVGVFDVLKFNLFFGKISSFGWFTKTFAIAVVYYLSQLLKVYLIFKMILVMPEKVMQLTGFEDKGQVFNNVSVEIGEIVKKAGSPV